MPPGSLNGPVKLTIARTSELSHRRTLLLSHYINGAHNVYYVKSKLHTREVMIPPNINARLNQLPDPFSGFGSILPQSWSFRDSCDARCYPADKGIPPCSATVSCRSGVSSWQIARSDRVFGESYFAHSDLLHEFISPPLARERPDLSDNNS